MYNILHNNCVNLNSENQIIYWANNNNNNNRTDPTIAIQSLIWPPIITYKEVNISNGNSSVLHYQWCGPMMLIVEEFAKRINAK